MFKGMQRSPLNALIHHLPIYLPPSLVALSVCLLGLYTVIGKEEGSDWNVCRLSVCFFFRVLMLFLFLFYLLAWVRMRNAGGEGHR